MDADGICHFSRTDNSRDVQVTVRSTVGADTDRLVCQANMHEVSVDLGVDSHGFDAQLLAGAQDAQGNFAAICDQDFF